jgi:hypothetical protein
VARPGPVGRAVLERQGRQVEAEALGPAKEAPAELERVVAAVAAELEATPSRSRL